MAILIQAETTYKNFVKGKECSASKQNELKKETISVAQCCTLLSFTQYSCHPAQILKNIFPQYVWKKDTMEATLI